MEKIKTNKETTQSRELIRNESRDSLVGSKALRLMNQEGLYHGRVNKGEFFEIDANFNNGANATGNYNVNKISALNLGDFSTAEKFAIERTRYSKDGVSEVVKISHNDESAAIFNLTKRGNNTDEDRQHFSSLMTGTRIPDSYKEEFSNEPLQNIYKKRGGFGYIDEREIGLNISKYGAEAENSIKSMNSLLMLRSNPGSMMNLLMNDSEVITSEEKRYLFDLQTARNWAAINKIVGVARTVSSVTIGEAIDIVQVFDLLNLNIESRLHNKTETDKKFGSRSIEVMNRMKGHK